MDYKELVRAEAVRQGLDPNLVFSVVQQESNWNPKAMSNAGAFGLFQLMPATAKDLGVDRNDPIQNIRGGVTYLKQQIDQFGLEGGLAAYNAGPGRFRSVNGDFSKLPQETQKYVPAILKRMGMNTMSTGQGYTVDQIISALGKANEANDAEAISELTGALNRRFDTARQKALAANDTEAIAEIDANRAKFIGGAPTGVAEATPVSPAPPAIPGTPLEGQPAPQQAPIAEQSATPEEPSLATFKVPAQEEASIASLSTKPPEVPITDQLIRQGQLFARNLGEGIEQTFTFPVRAIGEAAASGAKLLGFPEVGQKISSTVGMSTPMVSTTAANVAGLATPETQIEKVTAAGQRALAGAGVGNIASTLSRNAPQAVGQTMSALFPQAQTGAQLATFGGVGAGLEAAPMETAAGLAGVGTVAAIAAATAAGKGKAALNIRSAEKGIFESAGNSPSRAAAESEIIKKINTEYNAAVRSVGDKTKPLSASELNQKVSGSFIREAQDAVKQLPSDYPNRATYISALARGRALSSEEINALRTDKVGQFVADAIEQSQRSQVLTQAVAAAGGLPAAAARAGVDAAPIAISAATGIPAYIPQGFTAAIKNRLGGRVGRAEAGQKLVGDTLVKAADRVLAKTGPSEFSQGIKTVEEIADQAIKAQAANRLANQMASGREAAVAERVAKETAAKKAAEKAAREQAKAEEKRLISEGARVLKEGEAAKKAAQTTGAPKTSKTPEQVAQEAIAEQKSKDPTYILGISNKFGNPYNETQMAEFSKQSQIAWEKIAKNLKKEDVSDEVKAAVLETLKLKGATAKAAAEARQAMGLRGRPASGAYTEILNRTGVSNEEAIPILRKISKDLKDNEIGKAAKDILKGNNIEGNEQAFYSLQDILRDVARQRGALAQPTGALTEASKSPVFNPVSYKAQVKTAEQARDVALQNAPNAELAQFVSTVAGTKSPKEKAALLADRLANTTDPAQVDFLRNLVEPLTKFGKKGQ